MKTSDSSPSRYCGRPLSVLRVIAGTPRLQPKPKGPFPEAESYCKRNGGVKPDRPWLSGSGTVMPAVPVAALTENFSSRPLIAPPPLGRVTDGRRSAAFAAASGWVGEPASAEGRAGE